MISRAAESVLARRVHFLPEDLVGVRQLAGLAQSSAKQAEQQELAPKAQCSAA